MLGHVLAWEAQRRAVAARRHPIDQAQRAERRALAAIRRRLGAAPAYERWHVVGPHLRPEVSVTPPLVPTGMEAIELLGRRLELVGVALVVVHALVHLAPSRGHGPVGLVLLGAAIVAIVAGLVARWLTGDLR